MSRRYEFLDAGLLELITEPQELREVFEEWDEAPDQVALIIGDAWDAAGVMRGTLSQILERLDRMRALVEQRLPPERLDLAFVGDGFCVNTECAEHRRERE